MKRSKLTKVSARKRARARHGRAKFRQLTIVLAKLGIKSAQYHNVFTFFGLTEWLEHTPIWIDEVP
jgi:hypothetical protein